MASGDNETTICNGALALLSEGPITSLQQANEQARLCNTHYPVARRMALQLHGWKFATTRTLLNRLTTTPAFGFDYQYQLPTGCLGIWEVYPCQMVYVIESEADGSPILLTDEATPGIVYTRDTTDATRFSPLFVVALELVIAARLCMTLTEKQGLMTSLQQQLTYNLQQAKIMDAKENPSQQIGDVDMQMVRRIFE